jgi:hypothetical protein
MTCQVILPPRTDPLTVQVFVCGYWRKADEQEEFQDGRDREQASRGGPPTLVKNVDAGVAPWMLVCL